MSDESEPVVQTGPLDVHDPNPPDWARMPAADVVRPWVDGDNGSMLPWRRRPSTPPVVSVKDKYLTGTLDLRAVEFPYLVEFIRCRFEQPPDLRQANLAGIEFEDCWLPGLLAHNMSSDNDVLLKNCTVRGGSFDVTDARIKGSMVLTGSRLHHQGARALHADRLELAGALLATNLEVVGEVRIPGLRTGGNVNFSGAGLHNPGGCALDGNGLHTGGNLVCGTDALSGNRFRATGWIYLPSAQISSDLSLRGAQLRPGEDGQPNRPLDDPYYDIRTTLIADRIRVDGNAELDQGFASTGTLRMVNGHIGGSMRLTGAEVDVSAGGAAPFANHAMHFDGTEIGGDFDARGVRITGQSRLLDVTVRGSIRLDGAYLAHPDNDSWVSRRCTVASNVEFRDADIYGSVVMQGANIGANLDFRASRIAKPGRYTRDRNIKPCLDIRATNIGRDLICAAGQRPFTAEGEIRMIRAEVGREINFNGAELGCADAGTAVNAFGAQTQELVLTVRRPPIGRISLRQVKCSSLADNEKLWNSTGPLELDGFRYDALSVPVDLKDDAAVVRRLGWLRKAMRDTYSPGPYDQFAAMLRGSGNEEHADTVLIEKERSRYHALARGFRVLGKPVLLWSWLQRWMVGYGYRPVRALGWLVMLLIVGTLWFSLIPLHCLPTDVDPKSFASYKLCPLTNQDDHLVWNPFLYTLDLLIPLVDFGNKNRWALPGFSQWIAASLTAAGWILATTVAAGVGRMLRRT